MKPSPCIMFKISKKTITSQGYQGFRIAEKHLNQKLDLLLRSFSSEMITSLPKDYCRFFKIEETDTCINMTMWIGKDDRL